MSDEFFAISNPELRAAPVLGPTYSCARCGAEHPVEHSTGEGGPARLQFIRCNGDLFLVGIDGKQVTP